NVAHRIQSHHDVALNATGRQQMGETARDIAAALGDRSWKGPPTVWSSPVARALESAEIVQGSLADAGYDTGPLLTHGGFAEFEMGAFTGRTIQELQSEPAWHTYIANPATARFPDGEDMASIRVRLQQALDDLLAHDDGTASIVVTHGGIIRMVIHSV